MAFKQELCEDSHSRYLGTANRDGIVVLQEIVSRVL